MGVLGREAVASVPLVAEIPSIDVPLPIGRVPVDVDGKDLAKRARNHLNHHSLNTLGVESNSEH